jgi:hypothetical protein
MPKMLVKGRDFKNILNPENDTIDRQGQKGLS